MVVDIFAWTKRGFVHFRQINKPRARKPLLGCLFIRGTIFEIAAKAALTNIEIKRANLMIHACKCCCNMHAGRGFARPTLLVSENYDVCQKITSSRDDDFSRMRAI